MNTRRVTRSQSRPNSVASKISQLVDESWTGEVTSRKARNASMSESDFDEQDTSPPPKKKRKTAPRSQKQGKIAHDWLLRRDSESASRHDSCVLPQRLHSIQYHRPLLLKSSSSPLARESQDALLIWFKSVSSKRSMPWRKSWIDPVTISDPTELRGALARRAYEVWISEIMLQQTRVATVIDYWNRWMEKWPTVEDLAAADTEHVLAAWRGLGYYNRATRILEAAKLIVKDPIMKGLMPEEVKTLESKIPGVGRYTAGAVSAIVFGRAEPMVDGNVLRVLSRQLGVLGNVKTDKAVIDFLWAAADALVKDVARDNDDKESTDEEAPKSERPGLWGQGLMELGSTICTPKPNCDACPISSTCRAYQEGLSLVEHNKTTSKSKSRLASPDIEDMCTLCEPLEAAEDEDDTPPKGKARSNKTSAIRNTGNKTRSAEQVVADHAAKFPLKVVKKAVRAEETLVCAIRSGDGHFLLRQRPKKGLLAGLWEFPSSILDDPDQTNAKARLELAKTYVSSLGLGKLRGKETRFLGSVPWLFSHLKLTMHVFVFALDDSTLKASDIPISAPMRWSADVDQESMGTGMHKCWSLVKDSSENSPYFTG